MKIKMKVYEMIQELSQYDADQEVKINVLTDGFETNVVVDEDVKKGEEVEAEVDFEELISDFDIDKYPYDPNVVRIYAVLEKVF